MRTGARGFIRILSAGENALRVPWRNGPGCEVGALDRTKGTSEGSALLCSSQRLSPVEVRVRAVRGLIRAKRGSRARLTARDRGNLA